MKQPDKQQDVLERLSSDVAQPAEAMQHILISPKIDLVIEPTVNHVVRYLALAPSKPGEGERFQLSFEARFTNHEQAPVHLTKLRISFPAASSLPAKDIPIQTWKGGPLPAEGLDLAAGATGAQRDQWETENIILTSTPPQTIIFEVFAAGYGKPARFSYPLGRHESPVAGGGYAWMAKACDLGRGEYWSGIAAQHCCGPQLYALDLGVGYFGSSQNAWSELLPGQDGSENWHYRVWGKPVYAMADGTVETFANDVPNNPKPGPPIAGTPTFGSHFILRHGNEQMLYAHFQPGSLNAALMHAHAVVKAGDFLGLAGNSGNSSGPHLHIHAIDAQSGMLRPIPWHHKMVAALESTRPTGSDWQLSKAEGLALVSTLIYPGDAPPADDHEWSNWVSLGGELLSGPCVCSWAPNRLDVFVVGTDRGLYHKLWNGSHWSDWEGLGGQLTSTPAAVSWGPNRIDVFGRGADNGLYHKLWNGSHWSDWEGLGGTLLSGPAVSSRHAHHLDVFAEGADHSLNHRIWNGSVWTPWESLGGALTANPSAISWNDHRIDVFGPGTDQSLYHKWWDGSSWSGWEPHNRSMLFGPAVSSRHENHLDVFAVAPDGTLQHRIWTGSTWSRWESLGGLLTSDPAAVSWNGNRIDVFGRGTDNALYHTYWVPS